MLMGFGLTLLGLYVRPHEFRGEPPPSAALLMRGLPTLIGSALLEAVRRATAVRAVAIVAPDRARYDAAWAEARRSAPEELDSLRLTAASVGARVLAAAGPRARQRCCRRIGGIERRPSGGADRTSSASSSPPDPPADANWSFGAQWWRCGRSAIFGGRDIAANLTALYEEVVLGSPLTALRPRKRT